MQNPDVDIEWVESRSDDKVAVSSSGSLRTPTFPLVIACGDQTIISEVDNTLPLYGISNSEMLPTSNYDMDYQNAMMCLMDMGEFSVVGKCSWVSDSQDNATVTHMVENVAHEKKKQWNTTDRCTASNRTCARRLFILKVAIVTLISICITMILTAAILYGIKVKQMKTVSDLSIARNVTTPMDTND